MKRTFVLLLFLKKKQGRNCYNISKLRESRSTQKGIQHAFFFFSFLFLNSHLPLWRVWTRVWILHWVWLRQTVTYVFREASEFAQLSFNYWVLPCELSYLSQQITALRQLSNCVVFGSVTRAGKTDFLLGTLQVFVCRRNWLPLRHETVFLSHAPRSQGGRWAPLLAQFSLSVFSRLRNGCIYYKQEVKE